MSDAAEQPGDDFGLHREVDDGRIEFAFTPVGGERILPRSCYLLGLRAADHRLRSRLIEVSGGGISGGRRCCAGLDILGGSVGGDAC